jgi:hypothetical protein
VSKTFTPHAPCTIMSGDCFRLGRCLAQCRAVEKDRHEGRIKELERVVDDLRVIILRQQAEPAGRK